MSKKVVVLGVTGQIGQYLAQKLLDLGCDVYGISRSYIDLDSRIHYYQVNLIEHREISSLIRAIQPDEIYNLVSPTNINETINDPLAAYRINIDGLTNLCQTVQSMGSNIKLFNASSVEIYRGHITDDNLEFIFDDTCDNFYPISPYGISKVGGYWTLRYYREYWQMPFYTGILCNVVSPRLSEKYLLPKVIKHVKYHVEDVLQVGNIDIAKDFSHAADVVNGIILAVQSQSPGDYVISSGQSYTLRTLIELIYKERGITVKWDEGGYQGYDQMNAKLLVVSDPQLRRKYEKKGEKMVGHSLKLRAAGWQPEYSIQSLIHEMFKII